MDFGPFLTYYDLGNDDSSQLALQILLHYLRNPKRNAEESSARESSAEDSSANDSSAPRMVLTILQNITSAASVTHSENTSKADTAPMVNNVTATDVEVEGIPGIAGGQR